MVSSQLDDDLIHRRYYYYYGPKRDFANLRDGRVIPDEERELIHIQYMPVNDDNDSDDDDNDNSGNESNERESEAETYISDEQLPSLSDDDSIIHWDDDMDPNELLPRDTTDRIIMPPYNIRGNSMNSLRSQQSRGYFYPPFPDGKWSFGYLS
ncbi:unnamed protein product [Brugia pahangi]|uniref:Ovule protein n=1 Tax=Brugia pahangi TaxID=6280 RepID=A0A158PQE8_BRUPA|nr:unnamed protein product [Brugia pahangi]